MFLVQYRLGVYLTVRVGMPKQRQQHREAERSWGSPPLAVSR